MVSIGFLILIIYIDFIFGLVLHNRTIFSENAGVVVKEVFEAPNFALARVIESLFVTLGVDPQSRETLDVQSGDLLGRVVKLGDNEVLII